MIFLSRLFLNPRSRAVRTDLADCQQLHRTVMAAFPAVPPGRNARQAFGVLYRVESDPRGTRPLTLLVQSNVRPDWSGLPEGYLAAAAASENPACKAVDGPYEALSVGMTLAFRLLANPTRKVDTKSGSDGRRRNGKRVELHEVEKQIAWLARKGRDGGFELVQVRTNGGVPNARAVPVDKVHGRRGSGAAPEGPARLTFGAVLFEGALRITDAAAFRRTLASGIGSGKAYGFGLLSVARAGR